MILCLDAGNTRLKWGVADAQGWQAQGACAWGTWGASGADPEPEAWSALLSRLRAWPDLDSVWWVSVTHAEREAQLARIRPGLPMHQIFSTTHAVGVRNGYVQPERLGADRWCALIGARALEAGACLVVSAGTATTVDALDAEGNFLGGFILPGVSMMQQALGRGTARLPVMAQPVGDDGGAWPVTTEAAIAGGCLEAQVGAIERAFGRLQGARLCVLSGGAAHWLAPQLRIPVRLSEYLVLEGVRQLAQGDSSRCP